MAAGRDIDQFREQLAEQGYFRVPNFLAAEKIADLRLKAWALLFKLSSAHRDRFRSNGSLCNFADHPEFADVIANPDVFSLLKRLGATDPRWTSGYLISKPPNGAPLFWHQDWWGWDWEGSYESRPVQLFFMYYLVDTTRENGCLRVIPGSHRRAHRLHDLGAAHAEDLASCKDGTDPAFRDDPDEVAVPVAAGDLIVGDARLIHGAYPNNSGAERPLLTLWYIPDFSSLPETIQARLQTIYDRSEELDVDASEESATTLADWPAPLRAIVGDRVPDYAGTAAPQPWNRSPDPNRLLAG